MSFHHLKPGDKITRLISDRKIPMEMVVVKIEDGLIHCDTTQFGGTGVISDGHYWTFDPTSGAEVDDDLMWGPLWGRTGSFLAEEENGRLDTPTPD